ncbi:protein BPS1, chloroplastic-like [Coffea eugenioides]|uniref:Protein BPS1, chloroplastic-like n=1 Tax=Coffea arabica TaxID=13443 RepID=A0ABM4WPE0_COFAR|nr:protein BPS1, chloroplastic-like [Coffea arabica]XP_027157979.1 protein BPS1, chloroplastic-like [Coffea eugenioides]
MVILVEKLGRSLKFHHRLDHNNHPNHDAEEALLASFQAFRSKVSKLLSQIMMEAKPGSEFLSLAWVHRCLEALPMIDKAFAKLVVDVDYPIGKWEAAASEAYLKHSLNVLELLNKISSSLSHLSQARLALAHGLSLIESSPSLALKHLQKIQPNDLGNDFKVEGIKRNEEQFSSRKESIIHEAMMIMISSGLWLFGIMISGLCSDVKPYFLMRKSAHNLHDPSLESLDSLLSEEIRQKSMLKEIKEVNEAAAELATEIAHRKGDAAAEILGRRLQVLEKVLQKIGKQTDCLFSEVLLARNKLLDTIRLKK